MVIGEFCCSFRTCIRSAAMVPGPKSVDQVMWPFLSIVITFKVSLRVPMLASVVDSV